MHTCYMIMRIVILVNVHIPYEHYSTTHISHLAHRPAELARERGQCCAFTLPWRGRLQRCCCFCCWWLPEAPSNDQLLC